MSNCISRDNAGAGLNIAVNGPIGGNKPVPARDIQVVGGMYRGNGGDGIVIGSGFDGVRPENVQLTGVASVGNLARGIGVEAVSDLILTGAIAADNRNQGIWIDNTPAVPGGKARVTRVLISGVQVYDNGRGLGVDVPGIGVKGGDEVTINGGKVYRRPEANIATDPNRSRQAYGVGVHRVDNGGVCTNLRLLDVDASLGHLEPVAALEMSSGNRDNTQAVEQGYYRLQSPGAPEGSIAAPAGSEYVDVTSGTAYRKTAGAGPTGWVKF